MRKVDRMKVLLLALLLCLSLTDGLSAKPSVVTIIRKADGFTLQCNGKPFFIRGAGGDASLQKLAAIGGNSTRTWGVDAAQRVLDEAQKAGLTVSVGLWLGQLSGFDYTDTRAVEAQRKMVRDAVTRFKSHPAVLMWGLGNEMEMGGKQDSEILWKEVEYLAALIKSVDPDHPVMTVVAEINPEKIAAIKKWAPHVDVLGINTYGPALTLPQRVRATGWDRPYVVTEFGPLGWWESPKTAWDAPIEPPSSTRDKAYTDVWQQVVVGDKRCLGGYAFLWGHKWECTPTWFGMFLPGTEERLASVDAMATLWGHPPKNRVPVIASLTLSSTQAGVGKPLTATVEASDVDGDALTYRWEVRPEKVPDGQNEAPLLVSHKTPVPRLAFDAPRAPGAYRVYVYVSDGHDGAATANVPFRVVRP